MKKTIYTSILTTLVLSSCGGQAAFIPNPILTPNKGVASNRVQSMSNRYKPVPVEDSKRFAVDFMMSTTPSNSMAVIGARCQKFIEQAQLIEDGDIERFTFETFNGGSLIRLNLLGVKNPEQLRYEIFQNLVQFVFNDIKKTIPTSTFIKLESARLVDNSNGQPILIDDTTF